MLSLRSLRRPMSRSFLLSTVCSPSSQTTLRTRAFHATARREDITAVFLTIPHGLLSTLHGVMPWYAVIPLSAFVVRGIVLGAFGSWSRAVTVRYLGTHPLRQALAMRVVDKIRKKRDLRNSKEATKLIRTEVRKMTKQLDQRWECSVFTQLFWSISIFPIYLVMSETVRRMGNMRDGILGMILTGLGLKDPSVSLHGVILGRNDWFEPTLATEGMLWFPNLLEPDPNGYLPFIASGLMLVNLFWKGKVQLKPEQSKLQKRLKTGLALVTLSVGPVCQNVPAALMLYWASSTTSAILSNWYLDRKHSAPEGMLQCKRPLQNLPLRKSATSKLTLRRTIARK